MIDFAASLELLDNSYPRLMTAIDRDPHSPTYGSGDRNYWMYRMHDISSGVLQQSSLTLAYLNLAAREGRFNSCKYLKAENADYWAELALAINRFNVREFTRRQNLLDEYYPGEASFPGSSFAAYATLKSAAVLQQHAIGNAPIWPLVAEKFLRKGLTPAANQDIAAAAFLALYSELHDWNKDVVRQHVQRVLERKAEGGGFFEYGGIDLGYASVTLNYLCCLQESLDFDISSHIRKLLRSIAPFISRSGQFGGEFCSRQTAYVLPYGLVKAAQLEPGLARAVSRLDLETLFLKLDDRYLLHYCLASLAMATHELGRMGSIANGPAGEAGEECALVENRLLYFKNADCDLFLAADKGGAFYYESAARILHESGYRLIDASGKVFCSNVIQQARFSFQNEQDHVRIEIESRFLRFSSLQPSSAKTIALRLLAFLGAHLNTLLKYLLIKRPFPHEAALLRRTVHIDKLTSDIQVSDHVSGLLESDQLHLAPPSSFRLVPSSKFYQKAEESAFSKAVACTVRAGQFTRTITISKG